jgi:hypothetical protein
VYKIKIRLLNVSKVKLSSNLGTSVHSCATTTTFTEFLYVPFPFPFTAIYVLLIQARQSQNLTNALGYRRQDMICHATVHRPAERRVKCLRTWGLGLYTPEHTRVTYVTVPRGINLFVKTQRHYKTACKYQQESCSQHASFLLLPQRIIHREPFQHGWINAPTILTHALGGWEGWTKQWFERVQRRVTFQGERK